MRRAVIVDAVRTPIGRHGGALAAVRPDDLAAGVIRALVDRNGLDPAGIDDVIFGCTNQAGEDNRNVARMGLLRAGLPVTVPGQTVNRLCGSGLQAVDSAFHAIAASEGEVFIAGGVESMSRAPWVMLKPAAGYARGTPTIADTVLGWRFPNPAFTPEWTIGLGQTAEVVAKEFGVTREEQDAFAAESQARAQRAIADGRFRDELVPVEVPRRKGGPVLVDTDEHPRAGVTPESLARLGPVFAKDGTVTAGNSSGINDGAAALLVLRRSGHAAWDSPRWSASARARWPGWSLSAWGSGPCPPPDGRSGAPASVPETSSWPKSTRPSPRRPSHA